MSNEASDIKAQRLRFEVVGTPGARGFCTQLADQIARDLGCDEVFVTLETREGVDSGSSSQRAATRDRSEGPLLALQDGAALFNGHPWNLPLVINDMQRARVPSELSLELTVRKVRSCGFFPLTRDGEVFGIVECLFTRSYHRWRQEEVAAFDELARELASASASDGVLGEYSTGTAGRDDARTQYRRLARYGNVVILVTDANFKITDVYGNTEQILGVTPTAMQRSDNIWDVILDPRDRTLLRRRITRLRLERDELQEEVRVIHQRTGEARWMMLRALPQFSSQGTFLGWEGFGIDVTDRRRAQDSLVLQNQRLEALFEVARTLQGNTDAAMVILKALRALIRATGSRAGYGCLFDRTRGSLEVVAAFGLNETYLNQMDQVLTGPSLLRTAIDTKQGVVVEDFSTNPRAVTHLSRVSGMKSGILMPLIGDGAVYGAIVLLKSEAGAYGETDFDLVSAAASQITLAVRQAEAIENDRRQGEALAALYRLSHELAKYRSPAEICENAFPILQQEFSLKRGWFGVLNEQGTHVVGKGGFGPGIRRKLQEVQIELKLRHDFFDTAISSQRPVIVSARAEMECSGLNGLLERLKAETFVIVPLCSLGQVVGVLVVEPMAPGAFASEARLQLLVSMANEMATVLMARRFEAKMADSLKMRMAGLLAAGVAHNFNNMLQAVLGQVALIEMQVPKNASVLESTRTIAESAKRGASLVAQLLNFASQNAPSKQRFSVERMLSESRELYESLLGKRIELRIVAGDSGSDVYGDPAQLQQVITNLLANAKDAVASKGDGVVTVSTTRVTLRTGEVDPELAPGAYVRVDVRDNGVGMDAEAQGRCFEPFFTTKNVDQGTGVGISGSGLGLASAYSLVKAHAGIITLHSIVGEGATFSVYLPVEQPIEREYETAIGSPNPSRRQVLLLGWESGVKPLVTSIFESLGRATRSAYDVRQLVDLVREEPRRWGYVVVDLDSMRAEDIEVLEQLLEQFPELSVIGAATSPKSWLEVVRRAGRMELVEKPLGVWSVERAVTRLRSAASVRS